MDPFIKIAFRILLFVFFIICGINTIVGKEKGDTLSIPLKMNYSYTIECSKGIAPLFNSKDINGKNIDLAKLRDKYVLIDFWGSWCNPCIAMIPKIKKIHEENTDLIVISIAHDQENNTLQETRKIIAEKGMDWINIYQYDRELAKPSIATMYNIYAYPTTILIDPQGKIIYRGSGSNKYNELNTIIQNQRNIQSNK